MEVRDRKDAQLQPSAASKARLARCARATSLDQSLSMSTTTRDFSLFEAHMEAKRL